MGKEIPPLILLYLLYSYISVQIESGIILILDKIYVPIRVHMSTEKTTTTATMVLCTLRIYNVVLYNLKYLQQTPKVPRLGTLTQLPHRAINHPQPPSSIYTYMYC